MKNLALHLGHYAASVLWPSAFDPHRSTFSDPALSGHKPRARSARAAILAGGLALALAGASAWSQQYTIDGGFEATTANPALAANGDAKLWTKDNTSAGTWIISTTSRTGGKCMEFYVAKTTSYRLQTKQTQFNSVAAVVVQYYYKDGPAQTNAATTRGGIKYDNAGTSGIVDGTETGQAANWTKKTDILAVSGTPASTDFAYVRVRNSGSSGQMADYYIDDVAVYDGAVVDNTPPDVPTSPSVTVPSSTSLTVSWTAPATGIDGGGYLVVRGTSDPTNTPNVNGIYAVSNTVASGQTVVYIGTGTSFPDSGLTTGTTYYYRIYTFDKAFNYSTAAGGAAVSGRPCAATPNATSDSPVCAGSTLHLAASTVSGATYAWTGPNGFASSDQNPTIANATTAVTGQYSVTTTLNGCTSAAGSTSVTINPLPTAATDTYNRVPGLSLKINISDLVTNDTVGSTFANVNLTTTQNVTLEQNDTTILYPASATSQDDSFTYTITGPNGCTGIGTVTIQMLTSVTGGQVQTINVSGNSVTVNFMGVPGYNYQVQRATTLEGSGDWGDVGSPIIAPSTGPAPGLFNYTEAGTSGTTAYYRLKYVGVAP